MWRSCQRLNSKVTNISSDELVHNTEILRSKRNVFKRKGQDPLQLSSPRTQ